MGQYYMPTILAKNKKTLEAFMYSHDFNNGLKLMEHSYIGNDFVKAFESLILNNPKNVVWAGDYADKDKGLKTNVYNRCNDSNIVKPSELSLIKKITAKDRYIVNHTKKTYVDKKKVPSNNGWEIHPLPLLTCEGNGLGGGDFFGTDSNGLVGSWARDLISIESKLPKDFKELFFNLVQ